MRLYWYIGFVFVLLTILHGRNDALKLLYKKPVFSSSAFSGQRLGYNQKQSTIALHVATPNDSQDDSLDLELPEFVQSVNKGLVSVVKDFIILFYADRYFARFHALETIARVPYFSYVSVLHLYETLGWFRRAEYIKVHFAESWNEMHHLLIMEELGGDKIFLDRFLAQHMAFFYYWIVVVMYMISPAVAYDFNKNVEEHAYTTYNEYILTNEKELKALPAPQIAIDYYEKGDLSLFDAMQNFNGIRPPKEEIALRRPVINSLYDVFDNIREDEAEHARSMKTLQEDAIIRKHRERS